MSPETLRALIQQGESLDVEFKSEKQRELRDEEIVHAVVCLANRASAQSGWVLIGVEDSGQPTGARPRHGSMTDPIRLQALIANRTRPSLSVQVHVVPLQPEGVEIVAIEVPPVRTPVGTTDGVYVRRIIGGRGQPECVPMHFHEMQSLQATRGLLDYSTVVVEGATWDDLDPLEFERLRRFVRESQGQGDTALLQLSDEELAKALGAVEANHAVSRIRVLALLLFGKDASLRRFLPTHEVAFQVLRGERVEVNEFFRSPLLRVMEEVLQRFRARYREEEVMVEPLRVGVPDYSERAFREAVANALIHRDYTRLGAVHIQWHDDRIEISNPGGFPEGVHLNNILVTPPRPRNPLLADAFKRAGLVERTGRGIDIIFTEQLRYGRPTPSYERSTPADVVLVLPGGASESRIRAPGGRGESGGTPAAAGRTTLAECPLARTQSDSRTSRPTLAKIRCGRPRGTRATGRSGAGGRAWRAQGANLPPLGCHLPPTGYAIRLCSPTRFRTRPVGADDSAVCTRTRTNHPTGGGRLVPSERASGVLCFTENGQTRST
jgi:ATP-dependent DNA helicase RecG